ncbi:MAG TPA: hypothetical protein VN493_14360 [Thermoanaerobaculia bacterium]|nr:hypothetical protein [Thermoanaerobaculia bacterium]
MKKTLVVLSVALVIAGITFVASHSNGPARSEEVLTMNVSYAADVENPRVLAGFADNIFLGKVMVKQNTVYRKGHRDMPWTPYEVRVTKNIKGELGGAVSVLQEGGYSPEDGRTYLVNRDQLLKPGAEYLFVTRADGASNMHVLVPVYGDIRVKDTRDRRALLEGFTAAVGRQIPFQEPKQIRQ